MKSKHVSAGAVRFLALLSVLCLTALDQWTKYLAELHLKMKAPVILIPDILELHYLYPENRGIAFGMFQGMTYLFAALSVLFLLLILYMMIRMPLNRYYAPMHVIFVFLAAGAAGNMLDRFFRGYVIDFIYFTMINFPIFNVADIYVVCSGIAMILAVLFRYEDQDFSFFLPGRRNDIHE